MSRAEMQQFANDRIQDAKALLDASRWQGAYYLSGYAVECGLKSCILAYIETTGIIFKSREFLQRLGKSWTHDLDELVELAGLADQRSADIIANVNLAIFWSTVRLWDESSRYQQKTEPQAKEIYEAISDPGNGVFQWLRRHW